MRSPFELECLVSCFLGRLWERRELVGFDDAWPLLLGGPIVEDIAAVGDRGAKAVLLGLANLDDTLLGRMCTDLAQELPAIAPPRWIDAVGAARVTKASWVRTEEEKGRMIVFGPEHPGRELPALIVVVDDEQGGAASHVLTTRPYEKTLESLAAQAEEHELTDPITEAEPALARRRALVAMRLTDLHPETGVHEMYADIRALGLAYLRPPPPQSSRVPDPIREAG